MRVRYLRDSGMLGVERKGPPQTAGLLAATQRRIAGSIGDAISAASVSREEVRDSIYGDIVTQGGTEERQLASAQVRAEARCCRDGTVILDQIESPIGSASPLGHVPFLAPDPGKAGHAFFDRRFGAGHPCAIILDLLPRPLFGQTFEAVFTKGASNRLEHPDGKLCMAVGEPIVRLRREPPEAGGTAHFAPFVREIDEPLSL